MKKKIAVVTIIVALCLAFTIVPANASNVSAPASSAKPSVTLTSITIDPEKDTGETTNAPGAWSTNTGDPLTQVGVKSDGTFLNQQIGSEPNTLGEVSIPLQTGLNTFTLVGDGVFPGNLYYGVVLFFDGFGSPPIAVFNENGGTGDFMVQPEGTPIMWSPNGGDFFGPAPGTSSFLTDDGLRVEVVSFEITSQSSSTTDELSGMYIGANGIPDTTATLVLKVTPQPNALVEKLIDELDDDSTSFATPQSENAFVNKLNALADLIDAGLYTDAQNKLTNDLMKYNDKWGTQAVGDTLTDVSELLAILQEQQV